MQNFWRGRVVLINCAPDDLAQPGFELGQQFLCRGWHITRWIALDSRVDGAELFDHDMQLVRLSLKNCAAALTERPDSFMNVSGFSRPTL